MDKFLRIVDAKYPEEFERKVNELLTQGCWRVAETAIDPGRHYWAILIQSSPKEKKKRAAMGGMSPRRAVHFEERR